MKAERSEIVPQKVSFISLKCFHQFIFFFRFLICPLTRLRSTIFESWRIYTYVTKPMLKAIDCINASIVVHIMIISLNTFIYLLLIILFYQVSHFQLLSYVNLMMNELNQ